MVYLLKQQIGVTHDLGTFFSKATGSFKSNGVYYRIMERNYLNILLSKSRIFFDFRKLAFSSKQVAGILPRV